MCVCYLKVDITSSILFVKWQTSKKQDVEPANSTTSTESYDKVDDLSQANDKSTTSFEYINKEEGKKEDVDEEDIEDILMEEKSDKEENEESGVRQRKPNVQQEN